MAKSVNMMRSALRATRPTWFPFGGFWYFENEPQGTMHHYALRHLRRYGSRR